MDTITATLNRWIANAERANAADMTDLASEYVIDPAAIHARIAFRLAQIQAWRQTLNAL